MAGGVSDSGQGPVSAVVIVDQGVVLVVAVAVVTNSRAVGGASRAYTAGAVEVGFLVVGWVSDSGQGPVTTVVIVDQGVGLAGVAVTVGANGRAVGGAGGAYAAGAGKLGFGDGAGIGGTGVSHGYCELQNYCYARQYNGDLGNTQYPGG